jgi:anti-sigma B factor antagonist
VPQIQRTYLDPDVVVVQISGRITLGFECQDVELAVEDLVRDQKKKVVFDLGGLTYIDSTGIGIIVMCSSKIRAAGGQNSHTALHPRNAELMKVTRLDQIMTLYPTAAAALEDFNVAS